MSEAETSKISSNLKIAALFTEHRKRFLQTHNVLWFHAGYAPTPEDAIGEDVIQEACSTENEVQLTTENEVQLGAKEFQDYTVALLESPSQSVLLSTQEATVLDSVVPEIQVNSDEGTAVVWFEPEPGKEIAASSDDVQLFPFPDQGFAPMPNVLESNHYDLNVFDNGEMEEPPFAERNTKLSTFESVPYDSARHGETYGDLNDEPATLGESASEDFETLPSAEIAKSRLKNCL